MYKNRGNFSKNHVSLAMFYPLVVLCCILALSEATPLGKQKAVAVKDLHSRIINGENARLGQFPWQVALYVDTSDGTYFCGGSIISAQWVLTAAHCVDEANEFTVLAGTVSSSYNAGNNQNKQTTQYIQHERYNSRTLANDLGLVQVTSWNLNDDVQVISLSNSEPGSGDYLTVSGWGLTSDSGNTISASLKYVEVALISHNQCEGTYGTLDQGIICTNAGGSPHKGTCSGDSGGPLVSDPSGNNPRLQGVVSFVASDGCEAGYPDGYSGVSHFTSWISQNTDV